MLYRPTIILDKHLDIKSISKYYQKAVEFEHIEKKKGIWKRANLLMH